jgi:hypothetical protein
MVPREGEPRLWVPKTWWSLPERGGQDWQEGARSLQRFGAWLLDGSGEGGMSGNREPLTRVEPHSDFAMCLCREFVLVE